MSNNELSGLQQALEVINSQPEKKDFYAQYPLSVIWMKNVFKVLEGLIWEDSSAEEKLQAVQDTDLFNADTHEEIIQERTLQCWDSYFLRKGIDLRTIDSRLQESPYYQKQHTFQAFGKLFSLDFFTKLNILFDVKIDPRVVLEIGGGFGAQARLLKLRYPSVRCILIDLPETLFFAYINLRLNFPEVKIVFARNKEEVKGYAESQNFDFLLLAPFLSQYLQGSVGTIDLAINTRSFGEMHNKTSRYYLDLIENRLQVSYVLLLNRFLNTIDPIAHSQRLQENGCYTQLGPNWNVIHWEIDPEFTQFPFHEQGAPREVYFIGEKSQTPEEPAIEDIFLHYWYRKFDTQPNYHSKYNHHISIETSKNGVLSRLVNSVRVHPNPRNLDALIKYIWTLEGKFPFEERYYYMDWYQRITGKKHPLSKQYDYRPLVNKIFSENRLLYAEKFLHELHLLQTAREIRWWVLKKIKKNG